MAGRSGRSSTYELRVAAADAPRARALLTVYGMPRAARAGAAVLGSGSTLVSSPVEERARIAAAVARDVEQSLEAVDGVVEARVHLTFPLAEDQMFGVEDEARAPRASALLRHLGDVPPIAVEDVRRLVAGAVDGMAAEGVEVVFRAVRLPPAADGWESLGPFVLRSGGRTALVVVITTGLAVIAALAALLVWTRVLLRRARRHGDSPLSLPAADRWIARLLESSAVKALVVALIACSLLPQFDRPLLHLCVFLPLFGAEFALRLRLFLSRRRTLRRRRLAGDVTAPDELRPFEPVLLALDLAAVLSFLPIGHLLENGRLLRLARLVRLVIVVRYAADLLRDFWLVVTRRERLGQLLVLLLTVATLSFVAAALLVLAEPGNPLHGGNLFDAFWWAFLQLESADNLVRSVHEHPALVIASVLLTITGIFLMSFVIGLGTNIVAALVVASRHRAVDLEGHTVLSAPPQAARRILRDLGRLRSRNLPESGRIAGLHLLSPRPPPRRLLGARRVLLAGRDHEPPPFLLDHEYRGMVYRTTAMSDPRGCELVAAGSARSVVLVPDESDPAADDRCLSSALAVGESMARAAAREADDRLSAPRDLFLEVRDEVNVPAARRVRRRLHEAGIGCQVLDMERLVGLFLAQHVIDPDLDPVRGDPCAARRSGYAWRARTAATATPGPASFRPSCRTRHPGANTASCPWACSSPPTTARLRRPARARCGARTIAAPNSAWDRAPSGRRRNGSPASSPWPCPSTTPARGPAPSPAAAWTAEPSRSPRPRPRPSPHGSPWRPMKPDAYCWWATTRRWAP